ncbi:nucleotidyltransferase [Spirochaetia bacterium]|nr:nucleotidyltransferase [Spirochaetia bacterium]
MNLFDRLVETALAQDAGYAVLRPVVEKELFHYDILREMNKAGYLKQLVFIGGTCLRKCYGSERLSEDLDFAGGFSFNKQDLAGIGALLKESLYKKYNFEVAVSEPVKETGNTSTWNIKVVTRPERSDLPTQRINIDICMIPSRDARPVMLKDWYGIETGTSGLILYAESLQEILVDKIIALALRPNRVKNRDLWDIFWLCSRNVSLPSSLLETKLADRGIAKEAFAAKYRQRLESIINGQNDFLFEMRRFLSPSVFANDMTGVVWWECLLGMLNDMERFW